ncbi:MAG TPA: winged helix-turn-helix transcriptional regulator [Gaiellaceae bacterium]
MTTRSYGQYCGLAYALDLIGERWALLVVRDLILGSRRFTDLARGLPGIPSNVLSARLKELEEKGIILRRVLPRPASSVVYELTDYGRELEDILLQLGLWGSRSLGDPKDGEVMMPEGFLIALRAAFQPKAAGKLDASYEIRLGLTVLHAHIAGGQLEIGEGPAPEPDLVIETDPILRAVMAGEVTADHAVELGRLRFQGDRNLLERFFDLFKLPPPVRPAA